MFEYVIRGLIGILLVIVAIQDIKWKKIRLWIVILSGLLLCLCIPFCSTLSITDRVCGLVIGLGVILLSKVTRGKIGMGDGLVLGVTGMGLGFWGNMELFALALAIAAFFSIVLIILSRANRKKSIPFMPFLLLSYMFLNIPIWG